MKQFVEYQTADGRSFIAEVDESEHERGLARAAARPDEVVARSAKRFDEVAGAVGPAAQAVHDMLGSLRQQPDEVIVEFGIKLTFSAGAVVASASGEANFKVTLRWEGSHGT